MEEPAASPGATLAGGAPAPLHPAGQSPPEMVELLDELDQCLFAARLAAEAAHILAVTYPDDAHAALHFVLLQLDAAADRLRAFLARDIS